MYSHTKCCLTSSVSLSPDMPSRPSLMPEPSPQWSGWGMTLERMMAGYSQDGTSATPRLGTRRRRPGGLGCHPPCCSAGPQITWNLRRPRSHITVCMKRNEEDEEAGCLFFPLVRLYRSHAQGRCGTWLFPVRGSLCEPGVRVLCAGPLSHSLLRILFQYIFFQCNAVPPCLCQ